MFDLAHLKQVKWPVNLVTQNDAGEFVEVTIHATFERVIGEQLASIKRDERAELLAQIGTLMRKSVTAGAAPDATDTEDAIEDADVRRKKLLLEKLKGWGAGITENQRDVPYSREVAEALFEIKPVFDAFYSALIECSEQARPKTSPPSPVGALAAPPI